MKTWVQRVLVVWLVAGCAKTDRAIDEGPHASEPNVMRGMCSADADCPGSHCRLSRDPLVAGRCAQDAGAADLCEVDADCAEDDRCSSRGFCYSVGSSGVGG
jgi:hypothetical protein